MIQAGISPQFHKKGAVSLIGGNYTILSRRINLSNQIYLYNSVAKRQARIPGISATTRAMYT